MIDQQLRNKFRETQQMKTLVQGLKGSIANELKSGNPNEEVLKLVVKREEETKLLEQVGKIGQALVMIYNVIKRPLVLPKIFQVRGKVDIANQPTVVIRNLEDLGKYFASLEEKLTQAVSSQKTPIVNVPRFEIPQSQAVDFGEVINAIQDLGDKLNNQPKGESTVGILRKIREGIDSLASRPQFEPTPVTHISINPLQGYVKTTATTVGTTLTSLPGYGQLFNRRALQIYNNSANTIYIGGSDVTTANGIPVGSSNFSQVFDAGYNQIIYGIAATSNNNVRVIEVADLSAGSTAIQE